MGGMTLMRNIFCASPTRSLPKKEQEIGRLVRPLKGTINPDMTPDEKLEAIANPEKPYANYYDLTTVYLRYAWHLLLTYSKDSKTMRSAIESSGRWPRNLTKKSWR